MFFLRLLLFFPSITFSLLESEIMPYALLYSLVKVRRLSKWFFLILACLFFSMARLNFFVGHVQLTDIIVSLAAYLNVLLVFFVILSVSDKEVARLNSLVAILFFFWVILIFFQNFGLISGLQPLFEFLVPRGSATALVEFGGRGISLLSSEPARAGVEFLFLYAYMRSGTTFGRYKVIFDGLVALAILFAFKSAMVAFLGACYFLALHYRKPLVMLFLIFGATFITFNLDLGRISNLIEVAQQSGESLFWVLMNESGSRVITIYSFFLYGVQHPLGGGVGAWPLTSVDALEGTGIQYQFMRYFALIYELRGSYGTRGSGFLMNLMLDTGVIGVSIVCFSIYRAVQSAGFSARQFTDETRALALMFCVTIAIIGSPGAPVHWVVFALAVRRLNMVRYSRA